MPDLKVGAGCWKRELKIHDRTANSFTLTSDSARGNYSLPIVGQSHGPSISCLHCSPAGRSIHIVCLVRVWISRVNVRGDDIKLYTHRFCSLPPYV